LAEQLLYGLLQASYVSPASIVCPGLEQLLLLHSTVRDWVFNKRPQTHRKISAGMSFWRCEFAADV
jgi:hypothetical protein